MPCNGDCQQGRVCTCECKPTSREWVGLSDAEINLIYPCTGGEHDFKDIARAIEAKVKE